MAMRRARDDAQKMRSARRNERKDTAREVIEAVAAMIRAEAGVASLDEKERRAMLTAAHFVEMGRWKAYTPRGASDGRE